MTLSERDLRVLREIEHDLELMDDRGPRRTHLGAHAGTGGVLVGELLVAVGLPGGSSVAAAYYDEALHYLVTPSVLVWLFRTSTPAYRRARPWLGAMTLPALVMFWLLPVVPPRLLPDAGSGVLGASYPLVTAVVVMATANPYLCDAMAGRAIAGLGALAATSAVRVPR